MINLLVEMSLSKSRLKFIVQEHHAVKAGLHYDLRLEHNGVLVSWATRKLPDLVNDKLQKIRLFPQPDHNMDWFDFSGEIEDGYGKGNVLVWDKGEYLPIKWDSHITVTFFGTKLKGTYHFITTSDNGVLLLKAKQ